MESILKGKVLAVIGDSLIYGNKLGNAVTWPNLLGEKHGMTEAGVRFLTERALKRGYIRIVTCEK